MSRPQVVTAWLRIDCGHWSRTDGTWLRWPTADYQCACGFEDSASGDQVSAFVNTIRRTHATTCTNQHEQKDT